MDVIQDHGRTAYRMLFGHEFEGLKLAFGSEVVYKPAYDGKHGEVAARVPPIGDKTLPAVFLGYHLHPGGLWTGDNLIADMERLSCERLAIEIPIIRTKSVWNPNNDLFRFPVRLGMTIPPHARIGDDDRVTKPHANPSSGSDALPIPENMLDAASKFVGQDEFEDYWFTNGIILRRIHVGYRNRMCSPDESTCPIPLKFLDVTRHVELTNELGEQTTITNDIWATKADDYLLDFWFTGSTIFDILQVVPPPGKMRCQGQLVGYKAGTTRPPYVHANVWDSWGEERKRAERVKWSDLKPKIDKACRIRGIKHVVEPCDEEEYMLARAEAIRNLKRDRDAPAMPVDPVPLVHMSLARGESHKYPSLLKLQSMSGTDSAFDLSQHCEDDLNSPHNDLRMHQDHALMTRSELHSETS